jgi:hypothetical protein
MEPFIFPSIGGGFYWSWHFPSWMRRRCFVFFIGLAWVSEGFSDRKREGGKANIVDLVAEWLDMKP